MPRRGNLDEALTFYAKAGEQHSISGDTLNAGQSLLFCGQVHCANADWDTGRDCFRRASGILQTIPPIRSEIYAVLNASLVFMRRTKDGKKQRKQCLVLRPQQGVGTSQGSNATSFASLPQVSSQLESEDRERERCPDSSQALQRDTRGETA